MQHTPAPWNHEATMSSDFTFIRRINDNDGRVLAQVRYAKDAEQEENLANARLIAAAPDLLAQLDNAITALESVWNEEKISSALLRATIDEARAVMKKVTG